MTVLPKKEMMMNAFTHPLCESHVRVTCDGFTLCLDGGTEEGSSLLPEYYHSGICSIFHLLTRQFPALSCISILGILDAQEEAPFTAFDLWLQSGDEGCYLPMPYAATLFRDNGIPYYHKPPASRF